ncbi:Uncharacterised protein [Mycobacteroides abscessus]|nr:Uncharacterised protein [Mycobacteroides abscessus]
MEPSRGRAKLPLGRHTSSTTSERRTQRGERIFTGHSRGAPLVVSTSPRMWIATPSPTATGSQFHSSGENRATSTATVSDVTHGTSLPRRVSLSALSASATSSTASSPPPT